MNANVNKTNRGKLLAAILAIMMVFTGVAVIAGDNGVDAAGKTWNMDGDINANQDIEAGTDAVATGNFYVGSEKASELIIKDGASFVINEGVTVTIVKGSTLIVENGAALQIDGTLVIENGAYLKNAAVYDGTNATSGHYVGIVVNGTLKAEKNANIDGATIVGLGEVVDDSNGVISAVWGTTGQTALNETVSKKDADNTNTYIVSIKGSVDEYLNGEGTPGYWVAVRIADANAKVGDKISITINGRSTSDQVWTAGQADIWLNAGAVYDVVAKFSGQTYHLTVDTTGINNMVGTIGTGSIVVNDGGSFTMVSSGSNNSSISNQAIMVAVGGTVDINAKVDKVDVQALPSSTKNPYTYGKVQINDNQTSATPVDLTFTATSQKISSSFTGEGEENKTTRAVNYILNVDGDVNAGNKLRIAQTDAINSQSGSLYYANEDDECSNVPMVGIVSVTGALDVSGNGTVLAVAEGSILDVSGKLTLDSDKDGSMKAYIEGTVNVSGSADIAKASGNEGKDIDVIIQATGAYLNIIGDGSVTIDGYDIDTLASGFTGINGAAYETKDALYITGLSAALSGAATAEQDEVYVLGYEGKAGEMLPNPYVIASDIEVPADFNLIINGVVKVAEGATLTFNSESDLDGAGTIIVEGVVMDNITYDFSETSSVKIDAEVRSTDEDNTYYLYTTLKNALSQTTSGTIELYGNVDVEGTMTIPEGVIIDLQGNSINITNDSTLVVDGIIDSTDDGSTIVIYKEVKDGDKVSKKAGVLTLNNMIVEPSIFDNSEADAEDITDTIAGFSAYGTIGDFEDVQFLLSPSAAAANAGTLSDIASQGKVTYSGDLVFTASEDNEGETITIAGTEVSIGKIIINGFDVKITTSFTGTIEAAVTAGTSDISFEKANNYTVSITEDDSGDAPVTAMVLKAESAAEGTVTISAGTVEITGIAIFGGTADDVLVIAEGATLIVPEGANLQVAEMASGTEKKDYYSAIVIDGTLAIEEDGQFTYASDNDLSQIEINGTMNVGDNITFENNVYVDGTLAIAEDVTVQLAGIMSVNGTVTGAIDFTATNNYILAYPGASIDTANLQLGDDGQSDAYSMVVNINGEPYLTVYGLDKMNVYSFLTNGDFNIKGYEPVKGKTWYTDSEYQDELESNAVLEDTSAAYVKLKPLNADMQVSIGTGMSVYIDGIKISNGLYESDIGYSMTAVGTHTIEVTINPGYKGEATITFNGVTISNGGTFTITPEMTGDNADTVVLSVTGNITQDSTVVVDGGNDDSGMGLTDYLLIILVVLIVIMAIMVAMRLMRS